VIRKIRAQHAREVESAICARLRRRQIPLGPTSTSTETLRDVVRSGRSATTAVHRNPGSMILSMRSRSLIMIRLTLTRPWWSLRTRASSYHLSIGIVRPHPSCSYRQLIVPAESSSTFEHHEPSLGSPPSSFATTATLPISSERDNPIINLHPSSPSPTRPIWSDEIDEAHLSAGAQVSSGYSSNEWSENDLMEEDECRNVGSRRHHQGPRPENAESESESALAKRTLLKRNTARDFLRYQSFRPAVGREVCCSEYCRVLN